MYILLSFPLFHILIGDINVLVEWSIMMKSNGKTWMAQFWIYKICTIPCPLGELWGFIVFDHVIKRPCCITIIDFEVFVSAIFSSRVSRLQGFRMHTGASHIDVELGQNEEFQSTPGWQKCWQYVLFISREGFIHHLLKRTSASDRSGHLL